MKAVMLSIQPKWCELIASGKKTIEVRKTAPKLQTPFKCYIYEMKNTEGVQGFTILGRYRLGTVIGDFVCDYVVPFRIDCEMNVPVMSFQQSALSWKEFIEYAGDKPYIYGWHISDLKIYDTPKELGEFKTPCKVSKKIPCSSCGYASTYMERCERPALTRPPQSWCYVEELL